MERIGRLGWIQIDCRRPEAPRRLLGCRLWSGDRQYPGRIGPLRRVLRRQDRTTRTSASSTCLSRRPSRTVSTSISWVDDVEQATTQIEALGGQRLPLEDFQEYGFRWRVMADPEGNEFCLVYETPDGMTG